MPIRRAILMVGSPRGPRSNSNRMGAYLMKLLADRGVETATYFVNDLIGTERGTEEILDALENSDLMVFAFPLYVDSLPSMNIKLLKRIADQRSRESERKSFLAIVNSGFPEAHHNETALAICREFSSRANLDWRGGLALGGGMAIGARPIEELGGIARNIVRSLSLAADALYEGRSIPKESVERMALPIAPKWLFIRMGNRMWRRLAKENGVEGELEARPYGMEGE